MGDLGKLLQAKGLAASGQPEPTSAPAVPSGPDAIDWAAQAKVVLRMEKKGRGGKAVTLIQQVRGTDAARTAAAKVLAKSLGVAGRVEGEDLVVQGDQRDRVEAWLQARGVRRIVR